MDRDKLKKSVITTSRDLILALVIVLIIMGALVAYCRVWPPMVVVESGSMMHDTDSHVGVIDTGDMVLVRKVGEKSDIVTYMEGEPLNYRTYSSYGNVIVFRPGGNTSRTPIIHRALLWFEVNTTNVQNMTDGTIDYNGYTFDVPALGYYGRTDDIIIENYGPDYGGSRNLRIHFKESLDNGDEGLIELFERYGEAPFSGFLTMGDNNPDYDQSSGYLPVKMEWVVGKAVGELPWFGLIKLSVTNDLPNDVPPNSWSLLIISMSIMIGVPVFIDLGLPKILKKLRGGGREEDARPPDEGDETEALDVGEWPAEESSPEAIVEEPPGEEEGERPDSVPDTRTSDRSEPAEEENVGDRILVVDETPEEGAECPH